MIRNAILGINVAKAIFESDLMKMKQETRSIRNRTLSKEDIDFHLLISLAFHDLPRKNSDQLASLLEDIVKRCMNPTFHDKFQVKKMYTKSHDTRTKYIRGVISMMNTLSNPKVISDH